MAKVIGLGGAFIRANDPKALYAWYEQHLGISAPYGTIVFPKDDLRADVAVSFFSKTSQKFPISQPAMLNFQVDDLDGLLENLQKAGVVVDPKRDNSEYGRFAWFTDPEGNLVEVYEPPKE